MGPTGAVGWTLFFLFLLGVVAHAVSEEAKDASIAWGIALVVGGIGVAFFSSRQFDMFSPIFAFGVSFALQYGAAIVLPFAMEIEGPYGARVRSLLGYYPEAGLASYLALVGFYFGYSNQWIERHPSSVMSWQAGAMGLKMLWKFLMIAGSSAFVILLVSGVFFQITTDVQTPLFYSAVGFLQSAMFVAVPMAVGMALKTNSLYWRNAGLFSVVVLLFFGIPSGSKTLIMLSLIFLALAWNYSRRRFTRLQAAVAMALTVVLLLAISPYNAMYRDEISRIDDKERTMLDALDRARASLSEYFRTDPGVLLEIAFDYAGTRMSNVSVVAAVLQYQDQGGPLHLGETYFRVIYGLIPRFLWPNKPALAIGGEVAVSLGYGEAEVHRLGADSSLTSVGITFVGEQVYNFGWIMTAFVSMLFGAAFKWMYVAFRNGHEVSPVALGLYGYLWYATVFSIHESNFAGILAGAAKTVVVLILIFILLKFRKQDAMLTAERYRV